MKKISETLGIAAGSINIMCQIFPYGNSVGRSVLKLDDKDFDIMKCMWVLAVLTPMIFMGIYVVSVIWLMWK